MDNRAIAHVLHDIADLTLDTKAAGEPRAARRRPGAGAS